MALRLKYYALDINSGKVDYVSYGLQYFYQKNGLVYKCVDAGKNLIGSIFTIATLSSSQIMGPVVSSTSHH